MRSGIALIIAYIKSVFLAHKSLASNDPVVDVDVPAELLAKRKQQAGKQ